MSKNAWFILVLLLTTTITSYVALDLSTRVIKLENNCER